ncbi:WD40 repeat domain-containing protein [Deinococcus radiodurans]|uniref:WD40 repeat domain-containing protein n=1 Tax=Deinococcus radiodurans TaxID=1299 RepID=UPI001FB68696|nr:hypothetical protein [Deinococcus radiodurans]
MPRLIPLLALLLCASASAELRADITKGTPHGYGAMKVYDGQTLLFQATTRGLSAVTASKFSPDGRWLVNLTDQGYVQLWDVHKGERVKTFLAPFARVLNADFTPDSTRLLLNFWGDSTPTNFWQGTRSSFWSLEPLQRLGTLDGKGWDIGYSGNVHFDAAGKRMVTASFRFFGARPLRSTTLLRAPPSRPSRGCRIRRAPCKQAGLGPPTPASRRMVAAPWSMTWRADWPSTTPPPANC